VSHTDTLPAPPKALSATTMCEALLTTAAQRPGQVALRTPDDSVVLTYGQLTQRVAATASLLDDLGLRRGDALAIMLVNRPEFHVVDAAAMLLGATPFSLYNSSPPEQIGFVMGDARNRLVVTGPRFADVVNASGADARVVLLDELTGGDDAFDLEPHSHAVTPSDLLTIIYTSGTTGPPKGVELSHANMLAELRGVHAAIPLESGGRWVSFLPSAHVADRWGSHYSSLMTYGHTVTCVADPTQVMAAVAQAKPTAFGGVPRVWEKLKAALEASGAAALPPAQLRAKLGLDETRWFAVGAAPTPVEVLEFFHAIGLPLAELWGMSETCGSGAANPPERIRIGTVGPPAPGVEITLADDGEVLIRGDVVMLGYRNLPEQTAEAMTADGFLRTGDIGAFDAEGYLRIVDRKKEIIINAAGKNMSPANVESALKASSPLIGQACCIGDGRRYNTALIVLDSDFAPAWGSQHGVEDTSLEALARDERMIAAVQEGVDAANAKLARVEGIKKFTLVEGDWLPGSDELTPTMKLKRKPIDAKYAAAIEAMYAD